MLQSKTDTQLQYNLGVNHSLIPKNLLPDFEDALYLLHPEDTSKAADDTPADMCCRQPNSVGDVIKTVFWIAVSISVAIAIAQLN